MTSLTETAASTFNRVMATHSIELNAAPADFSIGKEMILPSITERGQRLSNWLFDLLFPRLGSGTYYHYLTLDAFEKVAEHGALRLFSTKKLSSDGEFIPLCQDLELDGYWRIGNDGNPEGEHPTLMDDLFYKSFVSSPDASANELWKTFAGDGTGVRIAVQIEVHPEYPNFRRVSYQGAKSMELLNDLLKSFRDLGLRFTPFGLSRMPGYHQLREYAYQNECRLIVKRPPSSAMLFSEAELAACFPFTVGHDQGQQCSYIDCSLQFRDCPQFKLSLVGLDRGPSCDAVELNRILRGSPWANLPQV